MTTAQTPQSVEHRHAAVPAWVIFGSAIIVEYLAVSYAVDARDLLVPAGLQTVLSSIGDAAPLLVLFPIAVFLTGGLKVRLHLRTLSAYRGGQGWMSVLGSAHLLLFLGAVALAQWIAAFDGVPIATGRLWLFVWFGALAASFFSLLFALWSPTMLVGALRGLRSQLVVGFFVSSLAWVLGLFSRSLLEPLAWLTIELVHALLTVIARDPVASVEQSLVGTSRFYVEVAPICSGIEGVGLMLTFVGAYLFIQRSELRWPRSFLLLPLSALLVWLLNVVRVTGLIAVGTWYSPEVALGGFHSKAGWVFFALSALGVVYAIQHWSTFRASRVRSAAEAESELDHPGRDALVEPRSGTSQEVSRPANEPVADNAGATAAYLAPMLAVLAAKLLTGLATSGFDYFYAVSVFAAAFVLFKFRRHYPPVSFGSPWLPLSAGAAVGVIWIVGFSPEPGPSIVGQGLATLPGPLAIIWLVTRALGSVVTVPLAEELAFRGYLLRRFSSADFETVPYQRFSWLGLAVSSVAFGALHSQLGLGVFAGLAFGLLTLARGRLSDAVVAHGAANAVIVAYVLVTGSYQMIT